jgi:hypothetical protein
MLPLINLVLPCAHLKRLQRYMLAAKIIACISAGNVSCIFYGV